MMESPGPVDDDVWHAMIETYRSANGASSVRLQASREDDSQYQSKQNTQRNKTPLYNENHREK